ncbi:hypothetical protein E3N88_40415 [Mikania micrantha]|uniref:Uncharacterized protein n=1 Tax=Mikania micrantha TaxID=192012 RepID=A0A5N6LPX0_9ASTR|nr:hypothetical protein E3N88_40415 [Mikania micrantha]
MQNTLGPPGFPLGVCCWALLGSIKNQSDYYYKALSGRFWLKLEGNLLMHCWVSCKTWDKLKSSTWHIYCSPTKGVHKCRVHDAPEMFWAADWLGNLDRLTTIWIISHKAMQVDKIGAGMVLCWQASGHWIWFDVCGLFELSPCWAGPRMPNPNCPMVGNLDCTTKATHLDETNVTSV